MAVASAATRAATSPYVWYWYGCASPFTTGRWPRQRALGVVAAEWLQGQGQREGRGRACGRGAWGLAHGQGAAARGAQAPVRKKAGGAHLNSSYSVSPVGMHGLAPPLMELVNTGPAAGRLLVERRPGATSSSSSYCCPGAMVLRLRCA